MKRHLPIQGRCRPHLAVLAAGWAEFEGGLGEAGPSPASPHPQAQQGGPLLGHPWSLCLLPPHPSVLGLCLTQFPSSTVDQGA